MIARQLFTAHNPLSYLGRISRAAAEVLLVADVVDAPGNSLGREYSGLVLAR